jgi:hypothetical protein
LQLFELAPQNFRLADHATFPEPVRARLLDLCRENLPILVPKLSAPSQSEMLYRLQRLTDDPDLAGLRPGFIMLRDEVRTAVNKATSRRPPT